MKAPNKITGANAGGPGRPRRSVLSLAEEDCDKMNLHNEFLSVFLSYGRPDEKRARDFYESLTSAGVRCFFFLESAPAGQRIHRTMSEGVNSYDRVVLLCSQESLNRPGVQNEIEQVLIREATEGGAELLIPIALDRHVFSDWKTERPDVARQVRARVIVDFTDALAGSDRFRQQMERLLLSLRPIRDTALRPIRDTVPRLNITLRQDRFLDRPSFEEQLSSLRNRGTVDLTVVVVKGDDLRLLETKSDFSSEIDMNAQLENACRNILKAWLNGRIPLSAREMAECTHWTCRMGRENYLYLLSQKVFLPHAPPETERVVRRIYEQTQNCPEAWHLNRGRAAVFFEVPTIGGFRLVTSVPYWRQKKGFYIQHNVLLNLHWQDYPLTEVPHHILSKFVLPQMSGVLYGRMVDLMKDDFATWCVSREPDWHCANASDP